jgi:hypothetical protein
MLELQEKNAKEAMMRQNKHPNQSSPIHEVPTQIMLVRTEFV